MAMRGARKEEPVYLSSSEESEEVDGVKPRPKLRTRRSVEEGHASPEAARPAKRRREAAKKPIRYADDDEEDEDDDEADDDDTENYVDQPETPSEDEQLPDNRRRSGRARKQVQTVIDLSDDDFIMGSSEEEAPKPKKKKKPAKSKAKGKSKSKAKSKRKHSPSDSSEEPSYDDSDVEFVATARANPESDGFIVEKILAREIHTLKEWNRMCNNKNTRFLTHCSIFVPEQEEQQPTGDKTADAKQEPSEKVEKEEKPQESAAAGEQEQQSDGPKSDEKKDDEPDGSEKEKAEVGSDAVESKQAESDKAEDKATETSSSADEQKPATENSAPAVEEKPATPDAVIDVDEEDAGEERFLVKWKTLSYLHTSWQTEEELLETDKNAKGKVQRFREKEYRDIYYQNTQGDEYFNPEFRIVDRILEIRDRPLDDYAPDYAEEDGEKKLQYFLIKWKALPYDDITWEREDDVGDDAAVAQYNDRIIRAAKRFKKIALAKHTPKTSKHKLNFRGYTAESRPPCRKEQTFQLRDYQLTGVNWMLFNWYQKRNSMLADEMGLGKTVQTVMYINHLAVVERTPQPFIIIAPLSTLGHWQREFDSWTNLNAIVYHGSATARGILQNYEFFLSEDELQRAEDLSAKKSGSTNGKRSTPKPKRNCYRFDVLITTYEMASATDLIKLAQIDWQLMVVDEAHRLKNRNSKLSNILHTRFKFESMLLLTGTPLQNNVEELWVLLNFLDGEKFDSKEEFLEKFGELTDSAQVERLHSELKPYLLRRMKEDVEKSLAPKEETIIEVELTVLQKQYYRAIYEKNTEFLARGNKKGDAPTLMNVLMELRKCCNHPFLVKGVEEREVRRLAQQKAESKEEIQKQISESLVTSSGKLVLLDKLLPRLQETKHRVLIFSQFKIMLDIIQDYLALRRYNCERIDGNITGNERQTAIDRFCREDSNAFIMLLSTRAGGVGINLTAADTVIIYDSDWNPQNDLQAQARCHRIGQKKSVKIYRLLTSKTYELQMFHKASLKLGLDQAVLGGMQNDDPVAKLKGPKKKSNPNARMSKEEIENLLKHGAYEMFKEQDGEAEAASKKFGEESIDQILSRSTTIVHDPTQNADGSKKNAMSSFSKATFVSSTNPDEEVDIDDPNFWTKVIGLKGVEEQKKEEPSPLTKRRCRRKVKSYLMDDSGDELTTSSRKKNLFGERQAKDEEFVISDDEDEEEEDYSDEPLAKDDFLGIGGTKKRKRSKAPVTPIHTHIERIVELVTSFGYGRWDDMLRHAPSLQVYPLKELRTFIQDYILNLVRVSTALTTFSRIGLDLEPSQVYIVSNVPAPARSQDAGPLDKYAQELKNACRRYRFLEEMMKDMGTTNLLGVAIPPRLWVTDLHSRAARLFRPKLQQIDTVYKLNQFVRQKFMPTAPIIALINELQLVGNEATVQQMIDSKTLPPTAQEKEESAPKPATDTSNKAETGAAEASTNDSKAELTTDAPDVKQTPSTSTSETPSDSTTDASTSEVVSDNTAATTAPTSSQNDSKNEATNDVAVRDDKDSATIASTEKSDTESVKEDKSPAKAASASEQSSEAAANGHSQQNDEASAKLKAERMRAMKVLHSLPHVDSPESVAPWWISRVDDALLMLYVCRDGWMKGRTLPHRMAETSTLFGDRAKAFAMATWPSVSILNRRVKVLLHVWTSPKKQRPQDIAPSIVEALAVHANLSERRQQELYYQQQQDQHGHLQQQLHRQRARRHQEQQRAQARQYNASFHGSRHNQFAKLIFSYGIPDVSTCRDDRERNEKWRYFLQDSQMGIGQYPLEELLAEALDLERVCRQRMQSEMDANKIIEPNEENSILGGKRGFWLLTTTQCKRLLHRVDLFRLLRTEILVLPPGQLVEVVSRVVQTQSTSTEFPSWWSSPRHDILLLQGVECYGLDEHLASVWKLPLFNSANTSNPFPTTTWVENYVTSLSIACRNLIAKARAYHPEDEEYAEATSDDRVDAPPSESEENEQSAEFKSRIRDTNGMREEDPYFAPTVRLRQLIESNSVRDKQATAQPKAKEDSKPKKEKTKVSPPAEDAADSDASDQESKNSQEKPKQTPSASDAKLSRNEKKPAAKQSADDVIDLEDDEGEISSPPSSRSASSSPQARSKTFGPAAAAAAKAERQQPTDVRPWDVIVIDDSNDESESD